MINKKRRLFAGSIAVVISVAIVLAVTKSGSSGYRSDTVVATFGSTNVFFSHAFEDHIVGTIPGILSLRVRPHFGQGTFTIFGPGSSVGGSRPTNSVTIEIIAVGETAEDARRVANEAAIGVCSEIQTRYGIRGMVVAPAGDGQRISYFNDTLQPAVVRLFDK